MPFAVLHGGSPPHLMSIETAGVALVVGFVVLVAIVIDYYRHNWLGDR